jgi:hypothetical protein
MVLCGDSYETLLAELETTGRDTGGRLVRYGEAYRRMPFQTHLLSCDETGAMQLQIMAEPDYQSRLTRAALRGQYRLLQTDWTATPHSTAFHFTWQPI